MPSSVNNISSWFVDQGMEMKYQPVVDDLNQLSMYDMRQRQRRVLKVWRVRFECLASHYKPIGTNVSFVLPIINKPLKQKYEKNIVDVLHIS